MSGEITRDKRSEVRESGVLHCIDKIKHPYAMKRMLAWRDRCLRRVSAYFAKTAIKEALDHDNVTASTS
jgi:hypothetical protein